MADAVPYAAGSPERERDEAIRALFQRVEAAGRYTDEDAALLARCFGDPRKAVRRRAANMVAAAITSGAVTPELCERGLDSTDAATRWTAAFTLGRAGRTTPRVIDVALEQFQIPDGDVRWAAAAIVTPVARVIEDLRSRLRVLATGADATARKMALICLADAGDRDVALAVRALEDENAYVRLAALKALARIGDASPAVLTALRTMAEADPEERIRRAATVVAERLTTAAGRK